jgi:hypothetical protein
MLLMALVLSVVAIVGALAPVPRERAASDRPIAPPAPRSAAPVRMLELRYPRGAKAKPVRLTTGTHVVIEVATSTPGQAVLSGLGLVQPADPDTPAHFDILATSPGSYDIGFDPAAGGAARVGRLVVTAPG